MTGFNRGSKAERLEALWDTIADILEPLDVDLNAEKGEAVIEAVAVLIDGAYADGYASGAADQQSVAERQVNRAPANET